MTVACPHTTRQQGRAGGPPTTGADLGWVDWVPHAAFGTTGDGSSRARLVGPPNGKCDRFFAAVRARQVSASRAGPLAAIARLHRVRRLCALGLGMIGAFDLVTSVLPPSRNQLTFLLRFAPLVLAQGAAVLLALCGLVLLALTRGLRRGQRQAWVLSCVVLVIAAVLHLARGIDEVQCALSLVLLAVLI